MICYSESKKQQREGTKCAKTNIKTKDEKRLQLQILVDSGCTHTEIDKKLVKEERIKIELMGILFEVFNTDGTKNREVIRFVLLEVKVNKHRKRINVVVIDLNGTDIFLGYDWLVKHNPEVNWKIGTIWFTRCLRIYRT